ncbi:hypothetical protein DFH09DRAFT_1287718 [Mycena vulgaris]|nr:hypothetical protein DFH09DRAFT_1287718 [Mycena vulgaris]
MVHLRCLGTSLTPEPNRIRLSSTTGPETALKSSNGWALDPNASGVVKGDRKQDQGFLISHQPTSQATGTSGPLHWTIPGMRFLLTPKMACVPKGPTFLVDFQQNVLDNSGARTVANNPVISYVPNSPPTLNQMWQFNLNVTTGAYTIANGVGGGNTIFLSYPAANTSNMLTTSAQASTQPGGQALNFAVGCINSNTALLPMRKPPAIRNNYGRFQVWTKAVTGLRILILTAQPVVDIEVEGNCGLKHERQLNLLPDRDFTCCPVFSSSELAMEHPTEVDHGGSDHVYRRVDWAERASWAKGLSFNPPTE